MPSKQVGRRGRGALLSEHRLKEHSWSIKTFRQVQFYAKFPPADIAVDRSSGSSWDPRRSRSYLSRTDYGPSAVFRTHCLSGPMGKRKPKRDFGMGKETLAPLKARDDSPCDEEENARIGNEKQAAGRVFEVAWEGASSVSLSLLRLSRQPIRFLVCVASFFRSRIPTPLRLGPT